jgi:hypothetical protein
MARLVKRAEGEVIVFIKDNTPATRADLELFFEDRAGGSEHLAVL